MGLTKRFGKGIGRLNKWKATVFFISLLAPICAHVNRGIENVLQHSSDEFLKYEIIRPALQHGHGNNVISSTRMENGLHANELILRYSYGNSVTVTIDLKLNHDLVPHNHFMRYQLPNDTDAVQYFNKIDVDLCHYKGKIRNISTSYVAISTCDGIVGVVYDGNETYYIDTKDDGSIAHEHYLYRHSHMRQNKSNDLTCGHDHFGRKIKRSIDDTIRGPSTANNQSLFVEFVLVVDHAIYTQFGKDFKKIHCKDIANIVNAFYEPLNVFIALVGVSIWNEKDRIPLSSDSDKTLAEFVKYRREVLIVDHPNDNAHLLTNQKFDKGVLGKAYMNAMCTHQYSGGIAYYQYSNSSTVASTIVHELGHTFGMDHDSEKCHCESQHCIMEQVIDDMVPFEWSSCSKEELSLAINRGQLQCLRNKPTKFTLSPVCGNGLVEPGEQCDCGLPEFCNSVCCDANTCQLKSNATCATGECCDLSTCRLRPVGTACRIRDGECDLPEYCSGEIEYCPENLYKRDTELCGDGSAYCYEGACRSHADQCKVLWGEHGESVEECYTNNVRGDKFGNCGWNWSNYSYETCSAENAVCGLLQCSYTDVEHSSTKYSFIVRSDFTTSSYLNSKCQVAVFDVGLDNVDPGLTPNGAKCGEEKMCFQQKCRSIERLRSGGIWVDCPENCNGRGTCDNKGRCHCNTGYSPPLCKPILQEMSDSTGSAARLIGGMRLAYVICVVIIGVWGQFL